MTVSTCWRDLPSSAPPGRPLGFAVFNAMLLLLDGLYLAVAMYATGATQSPIRFLVYLHLVAVSLLASYRTGLKIALWHSLLLFVVVYAEAAGLVPPVDVVPGVGIEFDRMPVLNVTSFWLFAIATSIFSALNERELRLRRADLQSLVDVGARLDTCADPGPAPGSCWRRSSTRFGSRAGVLLGESDGRVVVLATHGIDRRPRPPRRGRLDRPASLGTAGHAAGQALDPARDPLLEPHAGRAEPAGRADDRRGANARRDRRRAPSRGGRRGRAARRGDARPVRLDRGPEPAECRTPPARPGSRGAGLADRGREPPDVPAGPGATLHVDAADRVRPVTAVLFLDLDDFKVVNDTLGHAAGDALLVAVTERISSLVRAGDLVARLGGDEFAILTDDVPD